MEFLNYDGLKLYDKKTKEYINDEIKKINNIDVDKLATKDELDTKANKSDLFSGDYNDLTNKPTIPDISNLASKTEVNKKLSIQQAVGDAGKILKVGNDGNIEFVDGGSDLLWKGTKEEWEALSSEEKGKYEIVCITND